MTPNEESAAERFTAAELCRMGIPCDSIALIRNKDGVSVWRVKAGGDSVVLKCFEKPEYRREIANYGILASLGVPTLNLIARTDSSFVMEAIEHGAYRLGTPEDINDPGIAGKIALWYKTLHHNGKTYVGLDDFADEYDSLTMENLKLARDKTGTAGAEVWRVIERHFEQILSRVMSLPRTLVYTDFHYTNLAVARDNSGALVFDYNFIFKSYVYSDIRNVCGNFYNVEAKAAFLSAYGAFDEYEKTVDDAVSVLNALIIACDREVFPNWAKGLVEKVKDGRLLDAVEALLIAFRKGDSY